MRQGCRRKMKERLGYLLCVERNEERGLDESSHSADRVPVWTRLESVFVRVETSGGIDVMRQSFRIVSLEAVALCREIGEQKMK